MTLIWKAITSKVGIGVLIALAVFAALAWWGKSSYDHGHDAGAAKVQAAIDAPVTGWSARLAQCTANVAVKDAAIDGQNAQIMATAKISADALAKATADLQAARTANVKDAAKLASLMKPLTGVDTCARVLEADKRLLGTLP